VTEWIKKKLMLLIKAERSSHWLALSFSVGAYIAFSPYIGFHTVMALAAIYFFHLNGAAVFTASLLINNPWTMVPVYSADYIFGEWLCASVFPVTWAYANPGWMEWLNEPLVKYIGLPELSLWSFFVGGNALGLAVAFVAYPIMRWVFARFIAMERISP
jgi:uncharacterized protein (DUF2062 family)